MDIIITYRWLSFCSYCTPTCWRPNLKVPITVDLKASTFRRRCGGYREE